MLHKILCYTFILFFILTFELVLKSNAETKQDGQCGTEMEKYRQCMKKGLSEFKKLTNDERRRLKSDITMCFLNERCQNPFPPDNYLEVTRQCYYLVRNESRIELQNCVRRSVVEFVLPEDEFRGVEQMQLAVSLLIAVKNSKICPLFANRNRLADCIKNKASMFQSKSNANVDICRIKESCVKSASNQCTGRWNEKVIPALCKCINNNDRDMVERYKREYANCVRDRGFALITEDPTNGLVENSISLWCPPSNAKNPCADAKVTTTTASTTATSARTVMPMVAKPPPISRTFERKEGTAEEFPTPPPLLPAEFTRPPLVPLVPLVFTSETETSETTVTISTTETTTTTTGTTIASPNQNFFVALANEPFVQRLLESSPGLKLLTDLFLGKTDLSAIFPSINLISDFQMGLTNLFGNKLGQ